MALLVVLERLSPAERTAFPLHEVFGLPFDEVAGVVGRSPAAVRQLAARARRHVEDGRPPQGLRLATVNGAPGLVLRDADGVLTVIAFTVNAGLITALDVIRNPEKLTSVLDQD